jgi:hypothetical protein
VQLWAQQLTRRRKNGPEQTSHQYQLVLLTRWSGMSADTSAPTPFPILPVHQLPFRWQLANSSVFFEW